MTCGYYFTRYALSHLLMVSISRYYNFIVVSDDVFHVIQYGNGIVGARTL